MTATTPSQDLPIATAIANAGDALPLFDIQRLPNELIIRVAEFLNHDDLDILLWSNNFLCTLLSPIRYKFKDRKEDFSKAVKSWKPTVLKLLVTLGSDFRQSFGGADHCKGGNLLHRALRSVRKWDISGHFYDPPSLVKTVEFLLDARPDVNCLDNELATPLHAIVKGYGNDLFIAPVLMPFVGKVVGILLDTGADGNLKDCHQMTALHYAAKYNHDTIVEILLKSERCSDDIHVDVTGDFPIHLALEGLLDSPAVCRSVVVEDVVKEDRMKTLRILCQSKKNIDARTRDDKQFTALHRALKPEDSVGRHFCRGQYVVGQAMILLLVVYGANPHLTDSFGRAPLHLASEMPDRLSSIAFIARAPSIDLNYRSFKMVTIRLFLLALAISQTVFPFELVFGVWR